METRKDGAWKTMRGLIWIIVSAGMVVALSAALNRLPALMQKGFARQCDTIEDAKGWAGFDNVPVPTYFPEGISWPPSLILAQKKPFAAVVMEFRETGGMKTALIVSQSSSSGSDAQLLRIRLSELKEETRYRLKGKDALLQVGACDNGTPCSRITWQDGGLRRTALLTSSPFDLIKIAESMVH